MAESWDNKTKATVQKIPLLTVGHAAEGPAFSWAARAAASTEGARGGSSLAEPQPIPLRLHVRRRMLGLGMTRRSGMHASSRCLCSSAFAGGHSTPLSGCRGQQHTLHKHDGSTGQQ